MTGAMIVVGLVLFVLLVPAAVAFGMLAAFVVLFGRLPW